MRKISNEIAWNNGRQITLKTLYQGHIEWDYNMVGVVVAMVISTMHEKSCIVLHNARNFEKNSKLQPFPYLAIAMMKS